MGVRLLRLNAQESVRSIYKLARYGAAMTATGVKTCNEWLFLQLPAGVMAKVHVLRTAPSFDPRNTVSV
ncbi:hypothetical protein DPMN_009212 [Dreissena polymorpha]|uniref:Uncharacterized protein n=1 Tax=Dreissena polymorpha TaxID=45954 RepID=A0A9D4N004_DREPO|nr:hypothetical protein DPMN_008780 [Dreissena polymorpha]KAH3885219.1 hypothetical protein DPMN_009212 [Dreissena polymorpha]